MQILEDSHDKYDRGHCAECGTWCHGDHGAGQNIPCLCYDVLMLPPPRRSSPAQPFTFLSQLCQMEYIFHQLSIFLSLSVGCMIIVGEPACAVPPTPPLSVGFSCSITAAHTFPAAVERAASQPPPPPQLNAETAAAQIQ